MYQSGPSADHSQYAAVDRRDDFGASPQRDGDDAPSRRARAPRDGARDDLPAHARRGRRDPRRAAAGRHRSPRAAARPPRRHLPVRRPRSRPGGLRRARPPRSSSARPSRASTRSSSSLARQALARDLPILAICRGAQALNVACGGTLHQHIPGHRQTEPATQRHARGPDRRPLAPAPDVPHPHAGRELLPPPGGRPGRRRPARRRPRAGRHDRGDRGHRLRRSASSGTPRPCTRTCRCSRRSLGRLPVPNCASPRDTLGGVPALRLQGVVKRFGTLTAVDHLDLEVPEGTCVGLLGPNGAGKSTTMKLLTAQAIPDEGEIEILGLKVPAAVEGRARAVRRRAPARQPRRHAHRRAEPARVRLPLPRARARDRKAAVERALQIANLNERRDTKVDNLSRRHAPAAADRARARASAAR